jgi:reverse transcriptase-like protein
MKQQEAFWVLKEAFMQEPILWMWDPQLSTQIEVDAFRYAMGGVLLQQTPKGHWHPVAYRLKSMAEAEQNYKIYDKEMLAVV